MTQIPYRLDDDDPENQPMGLIVLQTDETIEPEFKKQFAQTSWPIYVSRIPSARTVTKTALAEMAVALPAAADLLPKARPYKVVGYGCTSASSVIGSTRVEEMVQQTCEVDTVTNPLRAAIACSKAHSVAKFALLSPYIEEVNEPLRKAFGAAGLTTDVFGTFGEAEEAKVVRISTSSVVEAAVKLGSDPDVDAVFLSCTNLRTFDAIPKIKDQLEKPVFSSNQCLAWHMRALNAAY
ncbi:MAG: Asp/Glu racemase [Pseudomonadota bacterium]